MKLSLENNLSDSSCAIGNAVRSVETVRDAIENAAENVKWNSMVTFTQGTFRHFDAVKMHDQIQETIKRVESALSKGYDWFIHRHRVKDFLGWPSNYFRRAWKREELIPWNILAIEPHQSGHPHGHLLVSHSRNAHQPDYCPVLWATAWKDVARNAGNVHVSPVRSSTAAIKYCTKYLLKSNDALVTMNLPFETEKTITCPV